MKVQTGVSGLDKLLYGGVPKDSVVLLSGSAGSGKTVMSLQFLVEGAKKKEKSLYLTFEESTEKICDQASQFGWDLKSLEKKGMFKIKAVSRLGIVGILEEIKADISSFKPKRMVIDSITFMSLAAATMKEPIDLKRTNIAEIYERIEDPTHSVQESGLILRKLMTDFVKILSSKQITTFLTSEIPRESVWFSRDTFTEFACDGIILLKATSIGSEMHRTLEVVKMRNSNIRGGIYSYNITDDGIKLNVK